MHDVEPAGLEFGRAAAAAVHIEDVDLEALRGIEAGIARHVPSQHRVDGVGDAGLEFDWLLRGRRSPSSESDGEDSRGDARRARGAFYLHVASSECFCVCHAPSTRSIQAVCAVRAGRHPIPAASIVAVNRRFGR